jgi:hypothetical protein
MTIDEQDELARLRDFVIYYQMCPCCNADRRCEPGCTFATDCPEESTVMNAARWARYGDVDAPDAAG